MFFSTGERAVAQRIFIPTVLALASLAGCDRGAAESDAPGRAAAMASEARGAPEAVPLPIVAIGHHAENAYDMAKTANWALAQAAVDTLNSAFLSLPAGTGEALIPEARRALDSLSRAVTARDQAAAAVWANWLTEFGARMSAAYAPPIPAAVTLLDYYGRELEIWSARRDVGRLEEVRATIDSIWKDLQPRVDQRGGAAESAGFARLVAHLGRARVPADFAALATPILDDVDKLEAVFSR